MERFRITSDPLDEQAVAEGLSTSEDGAVVVFSGIVRAQNQGGRSSISSTRRTRRW